MFIERLRGWGAEELSGWFLYLLLLLFLSMIIRIRGRKIMVILLFIPVLVPEIQCLRSWENQASMFRNMCVVLSQVCAAGQQSGSSSCLLFFFRKNFARRRAVPVRPSRRPRIRHCASSCNCSSKLPHNDWARSCLICCGNILSISDSNLKITYSYYCFLINLCKSKKVVGCVGAYSDVSKVQKVLFFRQHFDKHDKISAWLKFQLNRTSLRGPPRPFCVTKWFY